MNENRRQILEMLAAGKITADEAERLLAALDPDTTRPVGGVTSSVRKRFAVWRPRKRAPSICACWWRPMKR